MNDALTKISRFPRPWNNEKRVQLNFFVEEPNTVFFEHYGIQFCGYSKTVSETFASAEFSFTKHPPPRMPTV